MNKFDSFVIGVVVGTSLMALAVIMDGPHNRINLDTLHHLEFTWTQVETEEGVKTYHQYWAKEELLTVVKQVKQNLEMMKMMQSHMEPEIVPSSDALKVTDGTGELVVR